MAQLDSLPGEVLENIPLFARNARHVVLVSRKFHAVFTPKLYHTMWFEKRTRQNDTGAHCKRWHPLPTSDLDLPAVEARVTCPRKVHLWLHTLGEHRRLRQHTRCVFLMSNLDLMDNGVGRDHALGCDVPVCRRFDWRMLATLPGLQHLRLSPYWMGFFVQTREPIPDLQSVRIALPVESRHWAPPPPWNPRVQWDVADVLCLACQPHVKDVRLFGGQLICHGPGDPEENSEEGSSCVHAAQPCRSRATTLALDGVVAQGDALRSLLHSMPQLRTLSWRRPTNTCHTWQDCQCERNILQDLDVSLATAQIGLHRLELDLADHELDACWPWRCPRERHILVSLPALARLEVLKIATELVVGRRTCPRNPRARDLQTKPTRTLAKQLPPRVRDLTLSVDSSHAMYEAGYRSSLITGLVEDRDRLSSLERVLILDRSGEAYNHDVCRECCMQEARSTAWDARGARALCRRAGFFLTYQRPSGTWRDTAGP
ncbi:uncharacterized protein A1O9_13009 [Exophiala aquamarina CBS 119918]|uniref:Uncharacterized protein n=1 Tax=Exophiala aquamarina CBS 119918 TaxID=1182545 RepID=A0A072NUA3_9EURO|nr:uncharacterized protein A1O9_13009 [Exophiala aquamarina CBS 119918]KEF50947.1 hypothetical protein A1O9_13009 [Exophiala aquamarina CBS 119918]